MFDYKKIYGQFCFHQELKISENVPFMVTIIA